MTASWIWTYPGLFEAVDVPEAEPIYGSPQIAHKEERERCLWGSAERGGGGLFRETAKKKRPHITGEGRGPKNERPHEKGQADGLAP